jgi:hypothetical protein
LTPDQWRQDLRFLAAELERRHKNLYHTVSREEFTRAVAALDSAIPSLAPHQIVVRMQQIVAQVGDGHTAVGIPASFQLYPLSLYWFGTDLRVLAATEAYRAALGARVIAIGTHDIKEVQARVATCMPSAANENPWFVLSTSPAFIVRPEILHGLGVIATPGTAQFRFEEDTGKIFTLDVAPITPPPVRDGIALAIPGMLPAATSIPVSRQRPGESFWFTLLPDSQTVYVNFRGYRQLGEHAERLMAFLATSGATRLIVDLRQNGGGDFVEGRRHVVEPLRRDTTFNRKGRLYVLVGRRTFSAAMVNAIDFRKRTNAILVGEPIGERPNSYSENDVLRLPHSGVGVSYSTRYYKFLEEDAPAVMPDVRIDPDWPAFREGRDPVLEWVQSQR